MRPSDLKRLEIAAALSVAALAAFGFTWQPQRQMLKVKGPMKSENRRIGAFDRIVAGQVFKITLRVGEKPSLVLHAPADLLPHVTAHVNGGTLTISTNIEHYSMDDSKVTVDVTTPDLAGADISGVASLDIRGLVRGRRFTGRVSGAAVLLMDADVEAFNLDASGAAKVKIGSLKTKSLTFKGDGAAQFTVGGSAKDTRIALSGACALHGDRFGTDRADVDASGACNAELRVNNSLRAKASGASHIHYLGKPKVTKNLSGPAARIDG